jgi:hypothetical protein
MATVTFSASGLCSKWGFSDGNLLDDVLSDHGYDILEKVAGQSLHNRVLIACVKTFLFPKLPTVVPFQEIYGCHNPIRIDLPENVVRALEDAFDDLGVEVAVPVEAVLDMADAIRADAGLPPIVRTVPDQDDRTFGY